MTGRYLAKFFEPRSVVVIGTGDDTNTPAGTVLRNLAHSGFRGEVYTVESDHRKRRGARSLGTLKDIPHRVDLAIIPAEHDALSGALDTCARQGIHAAIVLSGGGFPAVSGTDDSASSYDGTRSKPRRRRSRGNAAKTLAAEAARLGIRILGPDTLGVIRPHIGLNATPGPGTAAPGRTALIAQSAGVCSAMLDWAAAEQHGFSAVATAGAGVDVDIADLLDYLVGDSLTDRILLHIEDPKDPRRFMSALRGAARVKPVVVLKSGRRRNGNRPVQFRDDSDIDSDELFETAVRRCGALRVRSLGDLFAASSALRTGRRLGGERLTVLSHSPGLATLAADWASIQGIEASAAGPPAPSGRTKKPKRTRNAPPSTQSVPPPIGLGYAESLRKSIEDDKTDGVLVIVTGNNLEHPDTLAEALATNAEATAKPILLCWMAPLPSPSATARLADSGISLHKTPEDGVAAFALLARHFRNHALLLQTPPALSGRPAPDLQGARAIVNNALAKNRLWLSESESTAVLRAFHIPTTAAVLARSPGEASAIADNIGLPVSLAVNSPESSDNPVTVTDGVAVRDVYRQLIRTATERSPDAPVDGVIVKPKRQRPAFAVRIVLNTDPVFGPVITLDPGTGTDRRLALPPLNRRLARDSLTLPPLRQGHSPLEALAPTDVDTLDDVLVRVSEICCSFPEVASLAIASLFIGTGTALAGDARIALKPRPRQLSRHDHLLIPPYPADLAEHWSTADGTPVLIRPIRPDDAGIERDFINGLSERARYFRFMQNLKAVPETLLARLTQIDYGREMALIAVVDTAGKEAEVGVARYITTIEGESCEFAVVVADAWQRRGIGLRLMEQLMVAARAYGFKRIEGDVLSNNAEMLALARKLGFRVSADLEDPGVRQVSRTL